MFGEGGEVEGGEPWHGSAQERSLLISCMAENDALRMELQQSQAQLANKQRECDELEAKHAEQVMRCNEAMRDLGALRMELQTLQQNNERLFREQDGRIRELEVQNRLLRDQLENERRSDVLGREPLHEPPPVPAGVDQGDAQREAELTALARRLQDELDARDAMVAALKAEAAGLRETATGLRARIDELEGGCRQRDAAVVAAQSTAEALAAEVQRSDQNAARLRTLQAKQERLIDIQARQLAEYKRGVRALQLHTAALSAQLNEERAAQRGEGPRPEHARRRCARPAVGPAQRGYLNGTVTWGRASDPSSRRPGSS